MATNENGAGKALTVTNQPQQLAQFGELSVKGIVDRKTKILEVMQSVMKEGVHYGKIPGCGDKPTLYKAGAEILATTFALAPRFAITKTEMAGGHREYEIICTLVHIPTGLEVGSGVGSCSTMESKYRWRKSFSDRKCPECGQAHVFKSKHKPEWFCWKQKGGCGATFPLDDERIASQQVGEARVENPDIHDQMNTVLKMAKKRAQVDATLTAVGASDILTQDIEDLRDASERIDFEDAEFTDRPSQPSRNQNGNAQRGTSNDDLEAIAHDLILDIDDARTEAEVRKLAPRFNALPKGSRARKVVHEAYTRRIGEVNQPQGAA